MRLEDLLEYGSARVLRHACQPLRRRAAARRLAARARQARATGRSSSARRALYSREDLEVRCYRWLLRLERGDESAFADAMAMWLEPARAARGLPAPERRRSPRAASSRSPMSGAGCACCSSTGRSPRPRPRSAAAEDGSARRAPARRGGAPAEAPARAPAEKHRQPRRRAKSRCWPRCATRATIRWRAAVMLEGPLAERLPDAELKYLWGLVGYEAAREHHERALEWFARAGDDAARRSPARVEDARRAARRPVGRGARLDRPHVARPARHHPAWVYWYGRALAATGRRDGQPRLLPAHRRPDRFLRPARRRGARLSGRRCRRSRMCRPRRKSPPPATEPGLARALELIRLGIRIEGVREWLFAIRSFDDKQLLAASELARRAAVYDRAIHTADRTSRVHNYALRYPVPYHDVFREYAEDPWRGRGLGAGPGAPGEPLHHRGALERRRRRADAGDAGHRALRRVAHRPAQLPPARTSPRSRPT